MQTILNVSNLELNIPCGVDSHKDKPLLKKIYDYYRSKIRNCNFTGYHVEAQRVLEAYDIINARYMRRIDIIIYRKLQGNNYTIFKQLSQDINNHITDLLLRKSVKKMIYAIKKACKERKRLDANNK